MKTYNHVAIGVIAAGIGSVIPDMFLLGFGWKKEWVEENNIFVKMHRFNHSWKGVSFWFSVGVILHILVDFVSEHNTKDTWNE